MKSLIHYFLILFGSFLACLVIVGILTLKTPLLRSQITRVVETLVSDALTGDVRVGLLTGDLTDEVTIQNTILSLPSGWTLTLDTLHVEYDLLSLLRKRIVLSEVSVSGMRLVVSRDTTLPSFLRSQAQQTTSPWSVECRRVRVSRGETIVPLGDSLLTIQDVEIDAALIDDDLILNRLTCRSENSSSVALRGSLDRVDHPEIDLTVGPTVITPTDLRRILPSLGPTPADLHLEASVKGTLDSLTTNIHLDSGTGQRVTVKGTADLGGAETSYTIAITGHHLDPATLTGYPEFPGDLNFTAVCYGTGVSLSTTQTDLTLHLAPSRLSTVSLDSSEMRLALDRGIVRTDGRLSAGGGRIDLHAEIAIHDTLPSYTVRAKLSEVNLRDLLTTGDLPPSSVNGHLVVEGHGFSPPGRSLKGYLRLAPSQVAAHPVNHAGLRFSLEKSRLRIDEVDIATPDGQMKGRFLTDFTTLPAELTVEGFLQLPLTLEAHVNDLNLDRMIGFPGRITGMLTVRTGNDRTSMTFHGGPSTITGITVQEADLDLLLHHRTVFIQEGHLISSFGDLTVAGVIDLRRHAADLSYNLVASDTVPLVPLLRTSGTATGVHLTGTTIGTLDSLYGSLTLHIDTLRTEHLLARKTDLRLNFSRLALVPSRLTPLLGFAEVSIDSAALSNHPLGPVRGTVSISYRKADLSLTVGERDAPFNLRLGASMVVDTLSVISARLDTLRVTIDGHPWQNDRPTRIHHGQDGMFIIRDVRLTHNSASVEIDGTLDSTGVADLGIALNGVDLSEWKDVVGFPDTLRGTMNAAGVLTGPINDPVILAKLDITHGRLSRFGFDRFAGDLRYRVGTIDIDCRLAQDQRRSMTLQGAIPIHRFVGGSVRDFPLFLSAKSDSLDLSWAQLLIPDITDLKGMLKVDLSLEGTVGDPRPSGTLQIINGRLRIPDLGLTVVDASAQAVVTPDSLNLTVLRLIDDKGGEIRITGAAGLRGRQITGLNGNIGFKRFSLIDTKETKGIVKGALQLGGELEAPTLRGRITILRAEIPFPEESETERRPGEDPLETFLHSPFIRRLSCALNVEIPRNLWIRSLDVNAEVEGNIDLTKDHEAENFLFFGSLQAIRGWYLYQGRSFTIDRGEMTFQGGAAFDPEISIVGIHQLPGEDEQGQPISLTVRIIVGGTINKPQVTLESDPPLSETDIMAYLLFGRQANLDAVETAALESRAKELLIGLAANRLKQTIGKQLGLDVIEIEGGKQGGQEETRVRLGKYLHEGLYIGYSQLVSTTSLRQVDIEKLREEAEVRVEYEVNNHLNVEGSMDAQFRTGLDLLLKFEW